MYNIAKITNTIISGHAFEILSKIPDNSIDMIITSPPYYKMRAYNVSHQIFNNSNCEHAWKEYIEEKGTTGGIRSKKVQIKGKDNFQITPNTCHRTCALCGAWEGELGQEPTSEMFVEHLTEIFMESARILKSSGTMWINIADKRSPSKSWYAIPDMLKLSLIKKGLFCRNQIIWHKPNKMPSPSKDSFTEDYELLYFFTKNGKYYFQQQLEAYTKPLNRWAGEILTANGVSEWDKGTGQVSYRNRNMRPNPNGRNMRAVWSINTVPSKISHFAMFPEKLIERPILAGCPENGIVLDPFIGSGTTARVAKKNNRNYIGIELNPEYAEIARKSLK